MSDVVVGLDVHLKSTQVTVMKNDLIGEIVKRERVGTNKAELRKCLGSVPKGGKELWSLLVFVGLGLIFSKSLATMCCLLIR